MVKLKKSWREKLADDEGMPKVVEITGKMSTRWGTGTVVIPAPREVDEIMRSVPRSKLITINHIRERLAKRHGASIGCPITTGIFAGIAARAAEEDAAEGKKDITPYWRTLKVGGTLSDKFPGGVEAQAAKLKAEGHTIEMGRNGKPKRVKDYEGSLVGK
ncbi:MAG TPA: methylated DNA-protein cysteine methyltransferase [Dehalococcoidales bacterium]|nr:methylated DNA-protein cysteine methyltransferase [Dehalococcoidales bacterium]